MALTRRMMLAMAAAGVAAPAYAQEDPAYQAQWHLMFGTQLEFLDALEWIDQRGDPDMAAGIIQAMRFSRAPGGLFDAALVKLTGDETRSGWFEWMLWQEQNPQVVPHESFTRIKRDILLRVDPNFEVFLKPEHLRRDMMHIRVEEITWGGVRKDGIPSLDNPTLVAAANADYLRGDDLVFGVSINGDARAYPLRIMGWHEMFNDVIGGVPLALAYCTLCGSGILFETAREGQEPFVFGSSGFLYRSNKLMFDRQTNSLWNQFTGKPVSGALAKSGIELAQRPVVIDTWENWRARNPETQVLSLETGHRRDYGSGVVYAEYFGSDDLMFPVLADQAEHKQKDYVFGIRTQGAAKAWPLDAFDGGRVINDYFAGQSLVLIGDKATRSVRAYERGAGQFEIAEGQLRDAGGVVWQVEEDQLVAPDGASRPRVAGHIAYWFAWDGYLGEVGEVYSE